MNHVARPRAIRSMAVVAAAALALTLTACSGDDPDDGSTEATTPVVTETATEPDTPTDEATEEPEDETGDDGTAAPTDAGSPTITGEVPPEEIPTDIPVAGGGAEDLAAFLPQGFPIPEELTITGDPTATAENWRVTFTVPDPAGTFDFFLEALPEAGFELRAGTSDAYNPDVASGAILAQDDDLDVNLLIVDGEVEISITTR